MHEILEIHIVGMLHQTMVGVGSKFRASTLPRSAENAPVSSHIATVEEILELDPENL